MGLVGCANGLLKGRMFRPFNQKVPYLENRQSGFER